ncbi:UNVERIFIED_CONTAM: hypothetical protein NCL1_46006 [Trichonephila clavipes]
MKCLFAAAIRDISRSCRDPNDFTVLNCIVKDFSPHPIDSVKGHASLSPLAQQKAKKKKETDSQKEFVTAILLSVAENSV